MLHSRVGSEMYWTRTGLGRTCVFAQLHICTIAWIFATFGKYSVPFFFPAVEWEISPRCNYFRAWVSLQGKRCADVTS